MEQRCEMCRFWDELADGKHDGRCMRYPPAIVGDPADQPNRYECFRGEWPVVDKSEWCGEWQQISDCRAT